MGFSPGTRLGPYEVTAQIGKGEMGEVYRATDTNLSRWIATGEVVALDERPTLMTLFETRGGR